MTTGHMPQSPDQPTTQVNQPAVQEQTGTPDVQRVQPTAQLPVAEDMARIIEEQIDIIAQKMIYHTQMLFGVSAMGLDPVNARQTALLVAASLRSASFTDAEHALVNLGDSTLVQINDQTLPFKVNSQVAGLLEGILIDTVSEQFAVDRARLREARELLDRLFQSANEEMQHQSKMMISSQAPGAHPNARK